MKKSVCIFILVSGPFVPSPAKEITVCSGCTVSNLKEAIAQAGRHDRITVQKGLYPENDLLIDKPVQIIGVDFPVIDGGSRGTVFLVKSDSVHITGLQIQNTGMSYSQDYAGIKITNSRHCFITKNRILNTFFGIYFAGSSDGLITGNEVKGEGRSESGSGNAIHLFRCRNMAVGSNILAGHRDGIYLEFVENGVIRDNSSDHHIRYGMHFMFSHGNEFYNNKFSENGAGVAVMYSKKIAMHDNIFSDNWSAISNGILLKDIEDSRIEKNIFVRNTTAVFAEGASRNIIRNNNFNNNGWALRILGNCEKNIITMNNFTGNGFEVVTNSAVNRNLFERNYWGDYTGYDLTHDGIGDIPHHPVKLFGYVLEQIPPGVILLKSLFIDLLNLAEKVTPVITPTDLMDAQPVMKPVVW